VGRPAAGERARRGPPRRHGVHPAQGHPPDRRPLVDHLGEIEALLAGAETIPDTWHGRTVTLAADWASFTEADLNEAANRLRRLGQVYALRLRGVDAAALDAPRGQAWTIRQIVEHVAGVTWYAEQVGRLY
jgi:hypothetical protein